MRLDQSLVGRGLAPTRSQAEGFIRLGYVTVNGRQVLKPGYALTNKDVIALRPGEQYVSRAGLKLASVAKSLDVVFRDKVVLDVGSSTGGFTDYALRHGARKVIAVDVGTDQLHPSLRGDSRIELHEKTDIRDVRLSESGGLRDSNDAAPNAGTGQASATAVKESTYICEVPDIVVADVSFVSLRDILPSVLRLVDNKTQIAVMVKPQFEARYSNLKHKGVIKNDRMRRDILSGFEQWAKQYFVIIKKADSEVAGSKGNVERFYLLMKIH